MKSTKFTAFLICALAPAVTFAGPCLDEAAVASVRSSIDLRIRDSQQKQICDQTSRIYKVVEALTLIKSVEFNDANIRRPLDQGLLRKTSKLSQGFWNYVEAQNLHALAESNDASCTAHSLYAFADTQKPGTIFLCPLFFDESVSIPDRVQVILHEARHFSGYPHVTCTQGLWKGVEGGCDEKIQDGGSYAVSTEAMARLGLLAKNLSSAARANAKLLALGYAQSRFNKPVFPRGTRALYLSTVDKGYFFDGKDFFPAPFVNGAQVVSRDSVVDVFPRDQSNAYLLNLDSNRNRAYYPPQQGSVVAQYNKTAPELRPEIRDIVNTGEFLCYVQPFAVDCTHSLGRKITIPLLIEGRHAFLPEELRQPQKNDLYILDDEQRLQRIQLLSDGQYRLTEVVNPLQSLRAIVILRGQRYGLREDGELLLEKSGSWFPVEEAHGAKFTSLSREFYWSSYFASDSAP